MTLFRVPPAALVESAAPPAHVLRIEETPLAPTPHLVARYARGELDGDGFARAYLSQLLWLYQADPAALEGPLSAASADGVLVVADGWHDEWYAPRRVLAGLLHHVGRTRRTTGTAGPQVRAAVPTPPPV